MSADPTPGTYLSIAANQRVKREDEAAERMREALRAICGPTDSGPYIDAYRNAGGGYEGLQAIARDALEADAQGGEAA